MVFSDVQTERDKHEKNNQAFDIIKLEPQADAAY